jgi:hypothetical protein
MKRSKTEIDKKIKSVTTRLINLEDEIKDITGDLFAWAGLKNAKKIVVAVRRNLRAEELRRKNLK